MANYFTDNDDLMFYVDKALPWGDLVPLLERGFASKDGPENVEEAVEFYRQVLELVGTVAAEEVAVKAPIMDRVGTWMDDGQVRTSQEHEDLFARFKELALFGMCTPRELGGMGAPGLLYLLSVDMLSRADISTMTHLGFHVATAVSLLNYSIWEGSTEFDDAGNVTKTRWGDAIAEICAGEAWGSMDLTEPGAGSDLAALTTRAVKREDGTWRLTGNKVFITSGHGQYHLVLAKTDERRSLRALSLFLVRRTLQRDGSPFENCKVERVEEKLGHHGSPTCSVVFEDSEGDLVGQVGEGFKHMLRLMNHARLGVGMSGVGICEAAFRAAREYARERVSMGTTIDRHPMIADYLDDMETTIVGLRALAMDAAFREEVAMHLEIQRLADGGDVVDADKERTLRRHRRRVRYLTPLLKYLACEKAVEHSRTAIQILGGNGYTRDYAPERILRDALVLPVYEGTSQIQALMALKDNLGAIIKNPQRFLRRVAAAKLNALTATDPLQRSFHRMESYGLSAQQQILWKVAKGKWSDAVSKGWTKVVERFKQNWDPKRDFAYGQLHAENLVRILADVAIAEILLQQAGQFPERRVWASRWIARAEPRVRYHHERIATFGQDLLDRLAAEDSEPVRARA